MKVRRAKIGGGRFRLSYACRKASIRWQTIDVNTHSLVESLETNLMLLTIPNPRNMDVQSSIKPLLITSYRTKRIRVWKERNAPIAMRVIELAE